MKQDKRLKNLGDLKAAEYNPRAITDAAFAGLTTSLEKFGDLGGIVFNLRTARLVSGHQRVKALETKYGKLPIQYVGDLAFITLPDTRQVAVRLVDWDEATEKAANIAANNPRTQGIFTDAIDELLGSIKEEDLTLYVDSGLSLIKEDAGEPPQLRPVKVQQLPTMTWVLVGIPTVRYGEIAKHIEEIAGKKDVLCEVTANDKTQK